MNPQELFEHNRTAYEAVMNHFGEGHQKACIVHATGTGKSYIIAAVADHFGRTLVVIPNNYVLSQVKSVVNNSNVDYITYLQLMIDAENKSQAFSKYDLFVFDEFHRAGAERWAEGVQYILEQNPNASIFGTTATPIRYLDNGRNMAEELFGGQIMSTLTIQDAWIQGILIPPIYVMAIEDFSKVYQDNLQKINSKYIPDEERPGLMRKLESAQQAWDMTGGVSGVIRENIHPDTNRIIVFCPAIERIEEDRAAILRWFRQANIPVHDTYIIDSSRSEKSNIDEMARFQQDGYEGVKIMISVNMLNEGVHVPRVDALIMLRRTISMNIYLQQMGRCMAASSDRRNRPVILDLQNNLVNVGLYSSFSRFNEAYQESVKKLGYTGENRKITIKGLPMDIVNAISIINEKFNHYCKNHDWNKNYTQAKAFFDENGHFPTYAENRKLYSWAQNWYTYHYLKNPDMNQEKGRLLAEIGFVYQKASERNDELWLKNYEKSKVFFNEHGHFPKQRDDNTLYAWSVRWWVYSYLKNPEQNEWKAELLRNIGFEYQTLDESWMDNYRTAKSFFDEHGRFFKSTENQKLYDWSRNWWKKSYLKYPKENEEKARMLTEIGFQPKEYMTKQQRDDNVWMKNYQEAKSIFETNGHFPTHVENKFLYSWAKQWWVLSYLKNPQKNQIKANMLTSIGYAYRSATKRNEDAWMTNYLEAKAFFDRHGHFPTFNEIEKSKKWARQWWNNIYLKNPEEHQQQAKMLLSIGFEFKNMKIITPSKKDELISDVSIIKQGTGLAVRCRVNGVWQLSHSLKPTEQKRYESLLQGGNAKEILDYKVSLAEKYFGNQGEQQNRGIKR